MKLTTLSLRLLPLALLGGLAPLASAQTTAPAATVISSVPYTISSSGRYIVAHDLVDSSTTNAITISVANVVLDLNGYFVSGSGSGGSTVILVNSVAGVTIKNGTVANGALGIYFGNTAATRDELVDSVTVTHCGVGVECDSAAPGSAITNSVFSSLTDYGMSLTGGFRVENNIIDTVTGAATGIFSQANDLLIGNTISNCGSGIFYTSAATDETAGKFLNNLLFNCTTPFTGGVNATGNN